MANIKFGVLGAGVIGMTTCLELQAQFPNADIALVAEHFNENTTSTGAAGIFRPGPSFSAHSDEATKYIIEESYRYYDNILKNYESSATGVTQVSGYIFSSSNPYIVENELIDKIVPVYRQATEDELKMCRGNWKYGSFFSTLLTECRKFLPWCMHRFRENGGRVKTDKLESFGDIFNWDFDLVFNCMGFGVKSLLKDRKLVPIRGQIIKVSAPWVKHFYYADYDTYIIPGLDEVTLGGSRYYDSYDLNLSSYESSSIWKKCTTLVPSLRRSSRLEEWVGLRPHRDPVRIEADVITTKSRSVKCVHNYGHGGYGVTTAPGSAKLAVKLAKTLMSQTSKL